MSYIARHAEASAVSLKIIDLPDSLRIVLHDNGKGMPQQAESAESESEKVGRRHHGIKNMTERVKSIGGELKVSGEGGCTIAITVADSVH